jgi:predicted Zn-ribbon and HTH transcriptional regulator
MYSDLSEEEKEGGMLQCCKCGHLWLRRIKKPVQCPRCKTYKWEGV